MKRIIFTFILLLTALASQAWAAPSISAVSGPLEQGRPFRITGSGFGSKVPAAPLVWADFESGLQPGALGLRRNWDQIQSMEWSTEGAHGSKGAKASDGGGSWSLRVDYDAWTRDGQRFYVYKKEKMNFLITDKSHNWKTFRIWPQGLGYPNLYIAPNNGRVFVEKAGGETGFYGSFKVGHTNWSTQEFVGRASNFNQKDGLLSIRYDGREVASGSIMTRTSTAPKLMKSAYVFHGVAANTGRWRPSWRSSNRMWVDDLYVDTTWARVLVGNGATIGTCSRLEIQIPTGWTHGQVQVSARTGSFSSGSRAYVYVYDADGNVNEVGFPVVVGKTDRPAGEDPSGDVVSVDAGPDHQLVEAGQVELPGRVLATAPATPAKIRTTWNTVSGPAPVTFTKPNSAETRAQFNAAGVYVLELVATDGQFDGRDHVTVRIGAAAGVSAVGGDKNIFNPAKGEECLFSYSVAGPAGVSVDIYDRFGAQVRHLEGSANSAGQHAIAWDGKNDQGSMVASGVYLVVKKLPGGNEKGKVVVLK